MLAEAPSLSHCQLRGWLPGVALEQLSQLPKSLVSLNAFVEVPPFLFAGSLHSSQLIHRSLCICCIIKVHCLPALNFWVAYICCTN